MVAAVADSLDFERNYTSVVIAWVRYSWPAVLHRERRGRVLVAQCDLEAGRSLNIAPPGWQKTFDPLRDAFNHEQGWSRPDDPPIVEVIVQSLSRP